MSSECVSPNKGLAHSLFCVIGFGCQKVLQTYIGGELHKFNKQTHFVFLASCEIQLLELPYDLSLDSSTIGIDRCVDFIAQIAQN